MRNPTDWFGSGVRCLNAPSSRSLTGAVPMDQPHCSILHQSWGQKPPWCFSPGVIRRDVSLKLIKEITADGNSAGERLQSGFWLCKPLSSLAASAAGLGEGSRGYAGLSPVASGQGLSPAPSPFLGKLSPIPGEQGRFPCLCWFVSKPITVCKLLPFQVMLCSSP